VPEQKTISPTRKSDLARAMYGAFAAGDRRFVEEAFTEDLSFSSPLDVDLDRHGYFARCWPGAGAGQRFEFVRLVEIGDEVLVTYEMTRADGGRGRNCEILSFRDERICRVEVYFGWDVL
jgi:ketosteroid isomerase-like protein